jgi:predicted Rossmann-fold nucleotide-binding protein
VQTRKFERPIKILLYGSSFWKEVIDFEALVRHDMIRREDLRLFEFVDDPATALRLLQAGLLPEEPVETPDFARSRCGSAEPAAAPISTGTTVKT